MRYLGMPARLAMAENNPDSQEARLRHVRRRINFGSDDENMPTNEELQRQLDENRRKELEEKKKKWNFDFKEERPLEGNWQWTEVENEPKERETPERMENEEKSAEKVAEAEAQ